MIGSSWAAPCNTDVKGSEQFCYPMFLAVWKQELNQMMKRLELGHEEELGLHNVPKNSQDFFACVEKMPLVCVSLITHFSFIPSPNAPFFPHTSHMNAFYLSFKFWIQWRMVRSNSFKHWKILWLPTTTPIAQSKRWEVFISQRNSEFFFQKDSGWSCLQHEQTWFLKQMDLNVCWAVGLLHLRSCTWDSLGFFAASEHRSSCTWDSLGFFAVLHIEASTEVHALGMV